MRAGHEGCLEFARTMRKASLLLALAGLWLAAGACAQDNQPDMARAQRAADNPLRMIIEAAKLAKPRARPATAAASAVPPSTAGASGVARPAAALPATPAPVVAEPATPPATGPGPVVVAAEPAPAPAVVPQREPEPEPLPVRPADPILTLPPAEAALPPLKLLNVVEPSVPRPLIGKLRGEVEAVISFTVNTDGSVTGAEVQSSSHRQMDAAVLEAVQQWRYEPIASARNHSVRLVLRQPG